MVSADKLKKPSGDSGLRCLLSDCFKEILIFLQSSEYRSSDLRFSQLHIGRTIFTQGLDAFQHFKGFVLNENW